MTSIIEAHGLVKRFGQTTALDGLDVVAEQGRILAVLGPNGAGKTTFVRALATLLKLDGGTLTIAGIDTQRDPQAVRRLIALAGQYAAVEPAMTGRENIELIARLFGQSVSESRANTEVVLKLMGLEEAADRLARTYSGGMRRKLDLGASLVGQPRLLLLDEPTTGLDPRSRSELWDAIRELVGRGTDVLLTTQYLDEADHLAGHIVIIDHGRVVANGTPAELKQRAGRNVVEVHVRQREDIARVAEALTRISSDEVPIIDEPTRRIGIAVPSGGDSLQATLSALESMGIGIDDIALRRPNLDEVFLELTGKGLEEEAEPKAAKGRKR